MKKPILKAYYGDIFFEFLVHDNPKDTILFLEGFPASADHKNEIEFLYNKGYNIFWPHYPGTYQSKGKFLEKNIVKELSKFVIELKKGKAISLWDLREVNFKIKKLILFGGSFSGAISCGLVTLQNFDKLILSAPVWDFAKHNKDKNEQDLNKLIPFVKRAYENLFRFDWNNLTKKIQSFKECSPEYYKDKLKLPILVLHDPQDKTVSINHTYEINKSVQNIKIIKHNNGHGTSRILKKEWKKINKFLNN